eukprot:EG_transcript_5875
MYWPAPGRRLLWGWAPLCRGLRSRPHSRAVQRLPWHAIPTSLPRLPSPPLPPRAPARRGYSTGSPAAAGRFSASLEALRSFGAALTAQQRRSLLILTGAGAVLNLTFGVVLPAFPMLAADIGMGAAGVSLLIAVPSAARLMLNLPLGRVADTRGRVPLMVAGELLAGLGVACTGLASSLTSLVAARFLVGTGSSMASAGAHAYLADLTQAPNVLPHRGKVMGIQSAFVNAAWVAGPALGGLVCDLYGPRLGFLLVGAVIGLCGLAYATLPETLHTATQAGDGEVSARLDRQGLRTLLANPTQQGVLAAQFALAMNYAAMTVVLPLHAAVVWSATPGQIGLLFSAVSILGLVGAPVAGELADRYGRKAVLLPALLCMGAGAMALGGAAGLTSFVGACVVWAVGEAFFVPPINALTADCAPPQQKGEALALSRQVGDVGFCAGPLALGFAYDGGGAALALGLMAAVNVGTAAFMGQRVVEELPPPISRTASPAPKEERTPDSH